MQPLGAYEKAAALGGNAKLGSKQLLAPIAPMNMKATFGGGEREASPSKGKPRVTPAAVMTDSFLEATRVRRVAEGRYRLRMGCLASPYALGPICRSMLSKRSVPPTHRTVAFHLAAASCKFVLFRAF